MACDMMFTENQKRPSEWKMIIKGRPKPAPAPIVVEIRESDRAQNLGGEVEQGHEQPERKGDKERPSATQSVATWGGEGGLGMHGLANQAFHFGVTARRPQREITPAARAFHILIDLFVGIATAQAASLKTIKPTGCQPAKHRASRVTDNRLNPKKIDKLCASSWMKSFARLAPVRKLIGFQVFRRQLPWRMQAITRCGRFVKTEQLRSRPPRRIFNKRRSRGSRFQ